MSGIGVERVRQRITWHWRAPYPGFGDCDCITNSDTVTLSQKRWLSSGLIFCFLQGLGVQATPRTSEEGGGAEGIGWGSQGRGQAGLMNPLMGRPYIRGARARDVGDFYSQDSKGSIISEKERQGNFVKNKTKHKG